jgi:hypothetical protein
LTNGGGVGAGVGDGVGEGVGEGVGVGINPLLLRIMLPLLILFTNVKLPAPLIFLNSIGITYKYYPLIILCKS